MLTLSAGIQVFVCTRAADMRKGFDGLSAMAAQLMRRDPLSGHLFVFRNRRGDRLKVLYWGGDGLCLWYKRLEAGTFEMRQGEGPCVEMSQAELMMLIEGISLERVERRKRFKLSHKPEAAMAR
jgi:transposase